MHELSFLWGFGVVWMLAVMLPGPNFVMAMKSSLIGSRGDGVMAALGISTGAVIWATATMLGLHALFLAFSWLYGGLKIVGGMYLVYLGVMTIRSAFKGDRRTAKAENKSGFSGYRGGVLTSLSNPKTAAFFGSVFMTLLPAQMTVVGGVATLIVIFAVSSAWYSLVALGFSLGVMHTVYERMKKPLSCTIGALMIFFGGKLIVSSE